MPHEVIMPALGMAQDTGLIVTWHKSQGDTVAEGDVLFEVETDKATMEVEAQAGGFLSQIRHQAGDDVPVGDVIALIGDSSEIVCTEETSAEGPAEEVEAAGADVPAIEGNDVIMPALGMAQDSGIIVAWHKAPGDSVSASDILFEVETDKATMEVEAGHDGFVAALLAKAGEEAPVGSVIAMISAEKTESPISRSIKAMGAGRDTAVSEAPLAAPTGPAAEDKPVAAPQQPAAMPRTGERILASPKTRRLALEQGLDLARLAEAGYPQPYHVKDLEALKALPAQPAATIQPAGSAPYQITARALLAGQAEFLRWMEEDGGIVLPAPALWAAFAAGTLRTALETEADLTIELAPLHGPRRLFENPDRARLSALPEVEDTPPDLRLRDLTGSPITGMRLGPMECPVLSVADDGDALHLTLDFTPEQLGEEAAISLLTGFARRLEEPLTHLL